MIIVHYIEGMIMSNSTTAKIITMLSILIFINSAFASAGNEKTILTKQETIKIAWYESFEGVPVSVISRANPEAKKELREILEQYPRKANIPVIISMLGYIGDSCDAAKLDDMLDDIILFRPNKKLTHEQREYFFSIACALGIMSYRGMPEAKAIVKKRIETMQWDSFGARFNEDEVLQRLPYVKYTAMDTFLHGYSVSQDPDMEKLQAILMNKLDKNVDRSKLWMSDFKRIKADGELYRQLEKEPIPADFVALFNPSRHITQQPPVSSKVQVKVNFRDSGYLETVIKEAVDAYEKIVANIVDEKQTGSIRFATLGNCFLDNGKQISDEKWNRLKSEEIKDFEIEKVLLADVIKANLHKYENFHVTIEADVEYQGLQKGTAEVSNNVTGNETVIVTFVIPDSAAIYKKHMPRVSNHGVVTRNSDGNLQVYMKKINGKWYWNPFGW